MKKALLFFAVIMTFFAAKAQTVTPGPAEKKITDTLCDCMTKIDLSKIITKEDASNAFQVCFSKHTNMLLAVAQEKKVDISDQQAMHDVGIEIGKDLLRENCGSFLNLSVKMAGDKTKTNTLQATTGVFKRIDLKGFNYIVITDNGNERSFLWLRQFPGSEKFMNNAVALTGKKLKISWQEIEVYLPAAKGYYKVKEITAVDFL
jgi:hypothetical protein